MFFNKPLQKIFCHATPNNHHFHPLVLNFKFSQQTINRTITHNNVQREYILYIPTNYTGSSAVPLLFNFHGFTFTANNQMQYGDFRPLADAEGFIIVHPQGTLFNGNTHWNVGAWTTGSTADDLGFTETLLDALSNDYNIDLTRVYSTGFSNGGVFSFFLACRLGDKFAAVASVGGSMTPIIYNSCNPNHPTPILQIHGTDDGVIPYNGANWTWPIEDLLQYWTEFNNGNMTPITRAIPDINTNDGCTAEHIRFGGGDLGTSVEHFKIMGGLHTWPGTSITGIGTNQDINAAEEIWKFLSKYDINGLLVRTSIEPLGEITPKISIYPNPTTSKINIDLDIKGNIDIQLLSISGETVHTDTISLNHYELDLLSFAPGIYILKIGDYNYKIKKE